MALSSDIQAQIAFKNLLGKSQTDNLKGVVNEPLGIGFDVPSFNVMMDLVSPTASNAVADGVAVKVRGVLVVDSTSNNQGFTTTWPDNPPSGTDLKTGNAFVYGIGSLENIASGQRITNLISDAFGVDYGAIPYDTSGNRIFPRDDREWVYQYNSGVFYQNNPTGATTPKDIDVYYYIGDRLLSQSKNTQTNIRVSATASSTNVYFATYSTPMISTYSSNYLFLIDFYNPNTGSASLNINGIGTFSMIKYTVDGPVQLTEGDIKGATGGTAGPVYYLLFNNGQFEFYNSSPVSSPGKLTNPNDTQYSFGGIERGTSFDKVDLDRVMKGLLYPNSLGSILSATMSNNSGPISTTLEVGNSLPKQTYTFSWTFFNFADFKSDTLSIYDVTTVTSPETYWVSPTNQPFTYSQSLTSDKSVIFGSTISTSSNKTRTFKVSAQRTDGAIVSKFIDVNWLWSAYYGSSTYATLTASQVFALNSTLASQSIGSWTISGSGYKYFAVPEDNQYNFNSVSYLGFPLAMAGTPSGYSFSYADLNYLFVTVSNSFNVQKRYKVYRTQNEIGATISFNIS